MYLNGLPNECLLIIFRSLNDLDDLISCSKVCERWSHLIYHRLYEVKYLTGVQSYCNSYNTVYFGKSDALKEADFWELLPNVKILDIADSNGLNYEDMINILINSKSIKGLVYSPVLTKVMARYCINLEMIATRYSKTYFTDIIIHCGAKLKQLYIWYFSLRHLERFAKYLPCLERLHMDDTSGDTGWLYNGPILENLKILEISLESFDKSNIYGGFHLIDFCPTLTSAYFTIYGSSDFFFDETIKNYCLQDLVIQYEIFECGHYWPSLKNFLFKFPNLRHLAIRGNQKINDNHIKELVHMLPNLIILDVRLSFGITRESADYIAQYCREYNRIVSFYFQHDEAIRLDWPELSVSSNRICDKFDFMKNCFLKSYTELPLLMDPID